MQLLGEQILHHSPSLDSPNVCLAVCFSISVLRFQGINNAAHIGGMIMGVLLAIAWYFSQKAHKKSRVQIAALILGTLMLTTFYSYCNELSTGLNSLWNEILSQNQLSF